MNRNALLFLVVLVAGTCRMAAQHQPYEEAPILYTKGIPDTPLTRVFDRIDEGERLLEGEDDREILANLLELLEIPVASQVLVFSKTSAQNARISPQTPRAIYFSDNAYIGWVQNGNIEAVTFDKNLGAVFHLLDLNRRRPPAAPDLVREPDCLRCHASPITGDHPGLLVRSLHVEKNGTPLFDQESHWTDHASPIGERWGGWFVTGEVEEHGHLGNRTFRVIPNGELQSEPFADQSIWELGKLFDARPYPGGGQSDVVALMVLEHQVTVHNTLVSANQTARRLLHQHASLRRALGEPEDQPLSESYDKALTGQAERIVRALLLADEADFEEGINGSPAFQEAYQRGAPEHPEFGSLKQLRLHGRLYKYRCSPLVYSEPFHALVPELKRRVAERIRKILTTDEEGFDYFGKRERGEILAILESTHPDFRTGKSAGPE